MPTRHVQLVSLTRRFTEIAVDNVDLTVDTGQSFSLLRPSGGGKATALRLIAGLEPPTSRRTRLDGVARRLVDRPGGGNALAVRKMRVADSPGSVWRRGRGPGQAELAGLRMVVSGLSVIGGQQCPVAMSS